MTLLILLVLHAGRHFGIEWELMADGWADVIGYIMLFALAIFGDIRRVFS